MEEMDDKERVEAIREMQATRGWRLVLAPILQMRIDGLNGMLRDPSKARKDKYPSDYIRGRLEEAEFVMNHPELMAETISNAMVEEKLALERQQDDDTRSHFGFGAGGMGPLEDDSLFG